MYATAPPATSNEARVMPVRSDRFLGASGAEGGWEERVEAGRRLGCHATPPKLVGRDGAHRAARRLACFMTAEDMSMMERIWIVVSEVVFRGNVMQTGSRECSTQCYSSGLLYERSLAAAKCCEKASIMSRCTDWRDCLDTML